MEPLLMPAAAMAAYLAFALLALGQARHAERVAGAPPRPRPAAAAALLGLALTLTVLREGWGFGLLLFAVLASLAALAVVATLTWRPRWLRPLLPRARRAAPARHTGAAAAPALLALGLSSCAVPTREAFDAQMAAFLGRSEPELVAALGVPTRTHEAGGLRFLEYERQRLVGTPAFGGFGRFGGFYGPGYGYGYGGGTFIDTLACSTTFTLRGGRVERFANRGNDCRAYPGALPA